VEDLMKSGNVMPWPEVRDRLNATLRGWSGYFHPLAALHEARLIRTRIEPRLTASAALIEADDDPGAVGFDIRPRSAGHGIFLAVTNGDSAPDFRDCINLRESRQEHRRGRLHNPRACGTCSRSASIVCDHS
jgi:hypothetical protein